MAEKKASWGMLLIGLVLGLFIALLLYLTILPEASKKPDPEKKPREQSPIGAKPRNPGQEPPKPRFEFYSILPELEVVVREEEALQDIPTEQPPAVEITVETPQVGVSVTRGSGDAATSDPDVSTAVPVDSGSTSYYLQTGSFQRRDDANRRRAQLLILGMKVKVQPVNINGQQWHRVYAGPYRDRATLDEALATLRSESIEFILVRARF